MKPATIRTSSAEIRTAFEQWLGLHRGLRLVILEGLTSSGKTTLTRQPFAIEADVSVNIEVDEFLDRPVPGTTIYVDAIDRPALDAAMESAIASSPLVVVQGAIAWPFAGPVATRLGKGCVGRVYLKRMRRLHPETWADEEYLVDRAWWPPTEYHRSIYRYHAEQQPWVSADLILERIESDDE